MLSRCLEMKLLEKIVLHDGVCPAFLMNLLRMKKQLDLHNKHFLHEECDVQLRMEAHQLRVLDKHKTQTMMERQLKDPIFI
jgi:hypothetical protein